MTTQNRTQTQSVINSNCDKTQIVIFFGKINLATDSLMFHCGHFLHLCCFGLIDIFSHLRIFCLFGQNGQKGCLGNTVVNSVTLTVVVTFSILHFLETL